MEKYFVTAIGTNSGKTIFSAVLVEMLQADYWKPIQSGTEDKDADKICELINNNYSLVHPSFYELKLPASPHQAAYEQGIEIRLDDFSLPQTDNHLVIEGAGGLLVPLNYHNEFVIDLAQKFDAELILVSDFYLGSINHTLLSYNEIKRRNLKIKGIVFNGDLNEHSVKIILQTTGLKKLLHIPRVSKITSYEIKRWAMDLVKEWI
jgi:dethiobiotin synthetase